MTGRTVRHLVLELDCAQGAAMIACAADSVPFDQQHHTLLTAVTTCPDCLAVHSAWHVVFVADLNA
jgi:hypothetical protein